MPRQKSARTETTVESQPQNGEAESDETTSEGLSEISGAPQAQAPAQSAGKAESQSDNGATKAPPQSEVKAKKGDAKQEAAQSASKAKSESKSAAKQEAAQSKCAFFAKACDWAKANAKKAQPYLGKASDWAWSNAAAVIGIAAAAALGGAFGLIVALLIFAVLNYYKTADGQDKSEQEKQ
ncbi:MAG: hypothetical protein LBC09_07080 [Helicobacteraceae bacterium]|jgi:hypothetical protein|nr:hypothetical protein [Helicobacteraceae bacterium]